MNTIYSGIMGLLMRGPRLLRKAWNRLAALQRYMEAREAERDFDHIIAGLGTRPRRLLADRLKDIASFPQHRAQMQARVDSMRREYFETEPFLKVARSPVPKEYSWRGATSIVFSDHELSGDFEVRWCDGAVTGTHIFTRAFEASTEIFEILLPVPGKVRGLRDTGTVTSVDGTVTVKGIVGGFDDGIPGSETEATFSARSISVRYADAVPAFVRYIYRGISLRGAPDPSLYLSEDSDGNGSISFAKDSFDTMMFGRRARITQLAKGERPEERFVAVTLAGCAVEQADENILWEVVSFVGGARAQTFAVETFDEDATCVERSYCSGVPFGPTSNPPFDLRLAHLAFERSGWTQLCDGFGSAIAEGYPLGTALHHLHDSNDGYYQVELKNLLFCIHTLFECWTDLHSQRRIDSRKTFERNAKSAGACASQFFVSEALASVQESIHFANERSGVALQELFFDSLGIELTAGRLRALKRRNRLFHRGFIKHDASNEVELQELLDDARALRTLSHLAILKLCRYTGPVLDYETYQTVMCDSGWPP